MIPITILLLVVGCGSGVQRNPRAGFGISTPADAAAWANRLGAGWYLDWRANPPADSGDLEYWPMVRSLGGELRPGETELIEIASEHPGMTWILGNEPDNAEQDNLAPAEFAKFLHDAQEIILRADPTAKIAVGGVTQATDLRLAYLNEVLASYQREYQEPLRVDWWTVHGYVLREERGSWGAGIPVGLDIERGLLLEPADHGDIERFKENIIAFRVWMREHGYQGTPLAVTEFGILLPERFGYTPEIVADYLRETATWMDTARDSAVGYAADGDRLVQRWAWFSLADAIYPVADLADLKAQELTVIGEAYRDFVKSGAP